MSDTLCEGIIFLRKSSFGSVQNIELLYSKCTWSEICLILNSFPALNQSGQKVEILSFAGVDSPEQSLERPDNLRPLHYLFN